MNGHKVVFVGPSSAGKTSIILRLHHHEFYNDSQPTIGASFVNYEVRIQKDLTVKLNIWDTAGQERYMSLVPMYSRGAEVVVVVFDFSIPNSFEEGKQWISKINEDKTDRLSIYLVPNKIDLVNLRDFSKIVDYAKANDIRAVPTSAKTGENVNKLFVDIASNLFMQKPELINEDNDLKKKKASERENQCC